jgi:hypothetical protein
VDEDGEFHTGPTCFKLLQACTGRLRASLLYGQLTRERENTKNPFEIVLGKLLLEAYSPTYTILDLNGFVSKVVNYGVRMIHQMFLTSGLLNEYILPEFVDELLFE